LEADGVVTYLKLPEEGAALALLSVVTLVCTAQFQGTREMIRNLSAMVELLN